MICEHPECEEEGCGVKIQDVEVCIEHIDWAMGSAMAFKEAFEEVFGNDSASN